MAGTTTPAEDLDASGLSFAIVWARFNAHITEALRDAAVEALQEHGAERIDVYDVPGAFELPFAARSLITSAPAVAGGTPFDAVIALGCVIRGETPHFEYVSDQAAAGCMQVQLETGIPVSFGVLTCDTEEQAAARAGGTHGNKGSDAALVAIEMARWGPRASRR